MATFNATSILIDAFLDELESVQKRMNPSLSNEYSNIIRATGSMAIEIIANSNAFYHNIEHSMMVTMHLQIDTALEYLRVTREGRLWEACLHSNIFSEEHSGRL